MEKRLQQFLSAQNISQSQFAATIGVARASVSHILAGRNKPGCDFIESMMRAYPTLNVEWLIAGTGSMFKNTGAAHSRQQMIPHVQENTPEPKVTLEVNEPSNENGFPSTATFPYGKKIVRALLLYSDGTFEEFRK